MVFHGSQLLLLNDNGDWHLKQNNPSSLTTFMSTYANTLTYRYSNLYTCSVQWDLS